MTKVAIYKYRKHLSLTQKELGEKIGVSANTINQYENGVRKPNIIILKKLANVLGCTTDQLLENWEMRKQ